MTSRAETMRLRSTYAEPNRRLAQTMRIHYMYFLKYRSAASASRTIFYHFLDSFQAQTERHSTLRLCLPFLTVRASIGSNLLLMEGSFARSFSAYLLSADHLQPADHLQRFLSARANFLSKHFLVRSDRFRDF